VDHEALARVLDEAYVGDLATLEMAELRAKRAECQELEVALSYRRRMAQGRLDLVGVEQRRRLQGGERPVGDDALVKELTAALADRGRPAGNGRLPQLLAPDVEGIDLSDLDAIAGLTTLSHLAELADDDVADLVTRLGGFEVETSRERRALHDRIDSLQAEITRRYRTGEASVDTLLS
jgi:hypothetical protein